MKKRKRNGAVMLNNFDVLAGFEVSSIAYHQLCTPV